MTKEHSNKLLTVVAVVILIGLILYFLKELQSILVPFFLAIIITFLFHPFYKWMKNKKIPSPIAIFVIILTILFISNLASVFIITSINSFSDQFPIYEEKLKRAIDNVLFSLSIEQSEIEKFKESMKLSTLLAGGSLTASITYILVGLVGLFGDFFLILIYTIFLLSETGSIRKRVVKALSEERATGLIKTLSDIFTEVRKYIIGKTVINLFQAIVVGVILWAFGVDFYIIWAFLSFFTHYIPNIGATISTILPGLMAFVQFESLGITFVIVIILIIVQNIIGNIIEPKIFGDQLDLSPILLLFSLIFWGYEWGIVGMILSIPIMSMLKITLSKFKATEPIAILMSYKLYSEQDKSDFRSKILNTIRIKSSFLNNKKNK